MIATTRYLYLFIFSALIFSTAQSQIDTNVLKKFVPPIGRQTFHDEINKEQKNILKSDGKEDKLFIISSNEEINFLVTRAATVNINWLQYTLEKDSSIKDQKKVRYLRGITNMLRLLQREWIKKQLNPVNLPAIIAAYQYCVELDKMQLSIYEYITKLDYATAAPLVRSNGFEDNPGIKTSREELVRKYCILNPEKTFATLRDNADMPFADSLVRIMGRKYPKQLYDFAQANNKLGYIIRNITDDNFIKAVTRMAKSKDGQQYFCFLDNIVSGKLTYEQIDAAKNDSVLYYKLLVQTQMNYVERAMNKDTAFEYKALTARLEKKAKEDFVNTINGLHNENAELRFRSIQSLTAEELYYLAVSSDGSIYTSSFVKGVYPLMMKKINNRSDSLLVSLHFDKYRKFIKMAAGYNTLSHFLNSFPPKTNLTDESDAEKLMKAFVGKLELGNGLEDGVDVADSYASIAETIKPLANEMLKNVQANYQRNILANDKRGLAIYKILNNLFLSADTSNRIDLTKELGIPPVYEMPYKSLTNDSGRVIMQVFFYGDKDGQGIFKGFVNMFSNANWRITPTAKWVAINSVKGKPVTIFANKALSEEGGEDEKAQKELCDYLAKNKLFPTITIHRGHSYYADATISQMFPSSKIVFLGSCGGYHLIHDVLEKAPDAHIIASKQIGATEVNRPFFQLLTEKIRTGNNIDWIPFWKELDKMVVAKEFEDYIPPYKNLGALFIKAYKIAMDEDGAQKAF